MGMDVIERICFQYPIGKPGKVSKISTGLINDTYLVTAGKERYILQKFSPIFGKEAIYDVDAVSKHLVKKGFLAQRVIHSVEGKLFVYDAGDIWRLLSFIPGFVFTGASTPEIVYESGKILGNFHLAMADFGYEFKHKREAHHATALFFKKFNKVFKTGDDSSLQKLFSAVSEIPRFYLPENLRKITTHGDPKISNIIFGKERGVFKARALVDLDDCGREHNVLVELGDAFRSWCANEEDDRSNDFDLEKFQVGLQGYFYGSEGFLEKKELELLPSAMKLITLELTARFLIDYFEDRYFAWDPERYSSRKDHNLARAEGQAVLYLDMESKSKDIERIIKKF